MTTHPHVSVDNVDDIELCRAFIERLEQLRDQLAAAGPEHFDQSSWFTGVDDQASLELAQEQFVTSGLDIDRLASFDLNACGATACLAGHGAVILARGRKRFIPIKHLDVAIHFGIPQDWFEAQLPWTHPGAELHDQLEEQGAPDTFCNWIAQMVGIQHRIAQYEELYYEMLELQEA